MKKTIEQLKIEQAAELEKLERENKIIDALSILPSVKPDEMQVYFHGNHISVKLWNDFRTKKTLADALPIVEHFAESIIDGEHWKDGSCSTWPAEINSNAKRESAVMDGSHAVEINVNGGRGFGPYTTIQFWTKVEGQLCEIGIPVCDLWALVPRVHGSYDRQGNFSGKVDFPPIETQTADSFRKWYGEPPAFHGSYYLADIPNFRAWASNHGKQSKA